jgi:hypothetical protein
MTDKLDAQIDRFFIEQMLPLALKAKSSGRRFLETDLLADASTYYVNRQCKAMSKADFETGGCASVDTVAADLRTLWRDDSGLGLVTLGAGLAALAKELRVDGQETGQVSDFIYVMY